MSFLLGHGPHDSLDMSDSPPWDGIQCLELEKRFDWLSFDNDDDWEDDPKPISLKRKRVDLSQDDDDDFDPSTEYVDEPYDDSDDDE